MRSVLLLISILALLGGCVSEKPAFSKPKDACIPVSVNYVETLCNYSNVHGADIAGNFCMYSSYDAGKFDDGGPYNFLTITYLPQSKSYESLKSEVPKLFGSSAVIIDNLGIGNNSFMVKIGNQQKSLMIFSGSSSVKVDFVQKDGRTKDCFSDAQIMQFGQAALSNISGK